MRFGRSALFILWVICPFVLSCVSSDAVTETPAVISHPTHASHQELSEAITILVRANNPVLISADALTETSFLVIDRKEIRSIANVETGRRLSGLLHRFRLVLDRGKCTLVHIGTAQRKVLQSTSCVPE